MLVLAWLAFALCLFLAVGQGVVVAAFVAKLRSVRTGPLAGDDELPKAAVILALRGPDPYLQEVLAGLLDQHYPDFRVFVIVDSEHDPVHADIARAWQANRCDHVTVAVIEDPLETCSLKCSALIQAVKGLDDSFGVVAFLDGDAPPHRHWLRDLVRPLADDRVGVANGNRWFVPGTGGWGSIVRYLWNVGGVVQVWLNGITWAGSMALRRDTIVQTDLLSAWSTALSVDGTVIRQLAQHRLKVHFVPSVVMINREEIGHNQFVRWVQRQLVAAKSCGNRWFTVAAHAVNLVGTQLLAILVVVLAIFRNATFEFSLAAVGLALYWGSATLCVLATEWGMRHVARLNGQPFRWTTWRIPILLFPGILWTQVAYVMAICGACLRRHVHWRGIRYDIEGVGKVRMAKYLPYQTEDQGTNESVV